MAEEYQIKTPEAIAISYDVAGIGTRFLATLIDFLAWVGLAILLLIGVLALRRLGLSSTVLAILGLTLGFILFWGYYILFETFWSGQTPGKRLQRIRVIKTSGYPIGFVEAFIRNLVRIVDFLPVLYGIGVIVMFISREARRLGDYAAGTVVVKERAPVRLHELDHRPLRNDMSSRGAVDPDELSWDVQALTARDMEVLRQFLDRAPSLRDAVRQRIGTEMADSIARRIGARQPLDPVRFLERVSYVRDAEL